MEIIKADIMGYCMGVRRAVESAEQAIKEFPQKEIFTLGPLIHNQNALEMLEKKGVKVLSKIEGIKNAEKVVLYNVNKQ